MSRLVMALAILPLVEALASTFGAAFLALGGIAIAAVDLWRHFRS